MKHRRYHDSWPTADEARAWTERRRADATLLTKYIAWFAMWFALASFAAPYVRSF